MHGAGRLLALTLATLLAILLLSAGPVAARLPDGRMAEPIAAAKLEGVQVAQLKGGGMGFRPQTYYRPPPAPRMFVPRTQMVRPPVSLVRPPQLRPPRVSLPGSARRTPVVRLPGSGGSRAVLPRGQRSAVLLPGRAANNKAFRFTVKPSRPNVGLRSVVSLPRVAKAGIGIGREVVPRIASNGVKNRAKAAKDNLKAGVRSKFNSVARGASVRRIGGGGGKKPPGPPPKFVAANDNSKFTNKEANDNVKFARINVRKQPKTVDWNVSSGIKIVADPKRTTTILGDYNKDMKYIINNALKYPKTYDFGAKNGGFNILNTPNNAYRESNIFWKQHNKPFLDAAVRRRDIIVLATKPTPRNLYRENPKTGTFELTGFGREYLYLYRRGYTYDPNSSMMTPNG